MLTRCPQCETIFRVSKKHISAAKGLVRCGSCKDVFNAKEHVIKSKKDLKTVPVTTNASLKPEPNVAATPVNKLQSPAQQVATTQQTAKTEPDSFDFIKDGFMSTGAFRKFDASTPSKQVEHTNKTNSKLEAQEREKSPRINFDAVFEDEAHSHPGDEAIIVKKNIALNNTPLNTDSQLDPASINAKKPQQAQVVKSPTESKLIKTGSFISQNVIDIKNAFSSISKKITNKVSNKIQQTRRDDESVKQSLNNKLNKLNKLSTDNKANPTITETTSAKPAITDSPLSRKKPAVMSLNSDTTIFSHQNKTETQNATSVAIENTPKKPNSAKLNINENIIKTKEVISPQSTAPKIKSKPKLKEDAALKLAIQLKQAALDKTSTVKENKPVAIAAADIKHKINKNTVKSANDKTKIQTAVTKPKLNINKPVSEKKSVTSTTDKKLESNLQLIKSKQQKKKSEPAKIPKQKLNTKSPEKTISTKDNKTLEKEAAPKKKDADLIAKEEKTSDSESDDIEDDGNVHIHMQTGDIPMVLRESLEELDIPSRSIEMTLFMISSFIFLCLGLLLQLSVFRSIEMQQNYPVLKPLITKMCQSFTCNYSGPRDIKKIKLISRDIRVHPTTKGVLLITATIINNASYQQPYPNFSVKLSNLVGKTSAQRFFSPKDYLGKLSNKLLLMPPKQPIRVALEVVDPGKEAINFEFKFLSRK